MPLDGIKAVYLDAGGTLIAPSPSVVDVYLCALEPLGLSPDPARLRHCYLATWAEFDARVGRGTNRYSFFPGGEREYWLRYVHRVLEGLGYAEHAGAATDALLAAFGDPSAWTVFPEVRAAIAELRHRGLRLGVISNWDSRLPGLLEALGLAREFDSITVSCAAGSEKPSRAIFEHALASLGVRPFEAFHVGDDPVSDVEGPRGAGMRAALLVRQGDVPPGAMRGLDGIIPLLEEEEGETP